MRLDQPNKPLEVREGEAPGGSAKAGDTVRWVDPDTGLSHDNLRVEFAYPRLGNLYVRGKFGRVIKGREIEQSQTLQMSRCAVTKRAGA